MLPVYFKAYQLKGQHWRWGSHKRTPLVQVLDGSGFYWAEALKRGIWGQTLKPKENKPKQGGNVGLSELRNMYNPLPPSYTPIQLPEAISAVRYYAFFLSRKNI